MLLFTKYDNPVTVTYKLLKALSIHVSPDDIEKELEKHPDNSSLLGISDVLTNFDIENAAYMVDWDNLPEVPCPFIAHTQVNAGDFLVVDGISNGTVTVSSDKWNKHKMSLEEFKKIFKGAVLTAEPSDEFSPESAGSNLLATVKTPAIIAGIAILFISALFASDYFFSISWQSLTLTVLKTAGLITSILLLVQSIDTNNPLIQKLCQGGSKTDCNAILSSKAAKVFDGLSWSEVGFFYFACTWLLLLFGTPSLTTWLVLSVLNVISLPYTFYSIYYQARVAKQWCVLCCTVQGLLWLEFAVLATNFSGLSFSAIPLQAIPVVIVYLLAPVILWVLIKPLFLKNQQLKPLKRQLHQFKYNTELFNQLLTAQPKYAQPEEEWSITLGNVEAGNIVTMVSNPYCQPCATAHQKLTDLLNQNGNVQARIIFTANNSDNDMKTPVVRHLMELSRLADKTIVEKALHDWYEQKQKNYES